MDSNTRVILFVIGILLGVLICVVFISLTKNVFVGFAIWMFVTTTSWFVVILANEIVNSINRMTSAIERLKNDLKR